MQNNHKVQYIQLKLIQWTYNFSRDWMTALLWKKKANKTHTLSNRNRVNLTEFYYKTDFVLLNRETFLYLCRCKKPCCQCKNVLKLWRSWRICTGGKNALEPSLTKHEDRVTCTKPKIYGKRLVLELSSKRRILEEVINGIRNQRVAKCTCYSEMYHSIA